MASGISVDMEPWLDTFSGDLRYSMNRFQGDGLTDTYELQFAGGYIDPAHVKAYAVDTATQAKRDISFTFIDAFNIQVTSAVATVDEVLVVYRDTPKSTPLVNFADGAIYNEANMDKVVTQAVFATAEMVDTAGESVGAAVAAAETAGAAIITAEASALGAAASAAAAAASAATANAASVLGHEAAFDHGAFLTADAVAGLFEPVDATILRDADIGSAVQAYDAYTAKTDVAQTFSAVQKSTVATDNDLTIDLSTTMDASCTPSTGGALTFTNIAIGQKMEILFINGSNYAITLGANIKSQSGLAATISATGRYILAARCLDGTNVDLTCSGAMA